MLVTISKKFGILWLKKQIVMLYLSGEMWLYFGGIEQRRNPILKGGL
jgi:hypothetical protein